LLLLKRGGEQVGEEPDREGQRELHERDHQEEGQRDDPEQVGQHAHEQVVLSPRECLAAQHLPQQLRRDLGVGREQLRPVPVVRRRVAHRVPRPSRRPPRRRPINNLGRRPRGFLGGRHRAQRPRLLLQRRPARHQGAPRRQPPSRPIATEQQLPLRREGRP